MFGIVLNKDIIFGTSAEKIFPTFAFGNNLVNSIFQFGFSRKSLTVQVPFPVGLSLAPFGVFYDGKSMLFTHFISDYS